MNIEQFCCRGGAGPIAVTGQLGERAQLVLVFGATAGLEGGGVYEALRRSYPKAVIIGCSTAGEILGQAVLDDTVVVNAMAFGAAQVRGVATTIQVGERSGATGHRLAASLPAEGLRHVMVFSDGLEVNGSDLVAGLMAGLPPSVSLTGGLSADGTRFERTLVILDGPPCEGQVAAVGFYGEGLRISHGCVGGWDAFGPERIITRSQGNVLYELDGKPALDLYKRYLGGGAKDLPASGINFPLLVRASPDDPGTVRTVLSVDNRTGGMTFAGDLPQGASARMMMANFDRLIDGAGQAAQDCLDPLGQRSPELAILISCVGRRLVLKQRTEEEVEAVRYALGPDTALVGFYSYGEISPLNPQGRCGLHNQTMTITTLSEA
jgi:hypothetical protein